jgi:hypothetical protein
MTRFEQLKVLLYDNKFKVAAKCLDHSMMDSNDIDAAFQGWRDYPLSFDKYPRRIIKTKTNWVDTGFVPVKAFG